MILAAKTKQSSFLFKTYLNALQWISFFFGHFKSMHSEQYLSVYSQEYSAAEKNFRLLMKA